MGEPKPTREQVDAWRRQAESDLRNARRTAEIGAHDVCVFLCQQAAERMLKAAYMAIKGQEAPRTHSLPKLLSALDAPDELVDSSGELTADYIITRYPGASDQIPADEYRPAESRDRLARAEKIIAWAEEVRDEALDRG